MRFDGKAQCAVYFEAGHEYLKASALNMSAKARSAHFVALRLQELAGIKMLLLYRGLMVDIRV